MTAETPRIFVVGSYMHAFVLRAQRFPRDGETVFGTDSEIGPGGKGSNQAIAAARLGANVTILACVGDDTFGAEARRLWQAEGLNEKFVSTEPDQATGMAFIIVDETGQNRIIVTPGANNALSARHADAAEEEIASSHVLVAQFEAPVAVVHRALEIARRHGVRTILNPAPARAVPDEFLSLVDIMTPNESEAQALVGESGENFDPQRVGRALQAHGVGTVVLTLGDAGAYVIDAESGRQVPGVTATAVDTTGAGDAFTGALAVALAGGQVIDDAVDTANLAGAFCVTRSGVVPGLGTWRDLRALQTSSTSNPVVDRV
ncbi:MAG: ribokinase [Chloroflexota bacterium]